MPDGNLFVSRACCGGVPVQNTSRLMWEVSTAGALVHQVAIGFASLDHTSLAVSPDGGWLLYLAGHDLYVSPRRCDPGQAHVRADRRRLELTAALARSLIRTLRTGHGSLSGRYINRSFTKYEIRPSVRVDRPSRRVNSFFLPA